MTFAQLSLDPVITKAIHTCGYTKPTPIQQQSIPHILEGKDIVACAQTGTGKTAAFVLPALQCLHTSSSHRKPRVLILTPTRELASQITQSAKKYGKFVKFNMASLVGGMPYRQQLRDLSRSVDLIVATPGRLLDHMENRRLDLSGIEMLVLDEADRMLDMGFIEDIQTIAKATPAQRQTLLFSATVDSNLDRVIKQILKNPVKIDLSQEKVSPAQIQQILYWADSPKHKDRIFESILANTKIYKAVIFTATKIGADKLAGDLNDSGYIAAPLHGDLKQNVRNRTIEKLHRGKIQFLVATDVAARGIDIADITHVFNYDLPRFREDYVHRIGRTGRAGKSGIAISFALSNEARHVQRIEQFIGKKLELDEVEGLEPTKKPSNPNSPRKRNNKPSFKSKKQNTTRAKRPENNQRSKDKKFADFKDEKFTDSKKRKFTGSKDKQFTDSKERKFTGSRDKKFSDSKERKFSGPKDKKFSDSKERKFAGSKDKKFSDSKERKFSGPKDKKFSDSKERKFAGSKDKNFSDSKERKFSGSKDKKFSDSKERKFSGSKDKKFSDSKERKFAGSKDKKFSDSKEKKFTGFKDKKFTGSKDKKFSDFKPAHSKKRPADSRKATQR